jgi:hypothetical protein
MTVALEELLAHAPADTAAALVTALPPERAVRALIRRSGFTLDASVFQAACRKLLAAEIAEVAAACASPTVLDLLLGDARPTVLDGLARNPHLGVEQARRLLQDSVSQGPLRARRIFTLLDNLARRHQLLPAVEGIVVGESRNWPHIDETSSWGGRFSILLAGLDADDFCAVTCTPLLRTLTRKSALELLGHVRPAAGWKLTADQVKGLIDLHMRTHSHAHVGAAGVGQALRQAERYGTIDADDLAGIVTDPANLAHLSLALSSLGGRELVARALLNLLEQTQAGAAPTGAPSSDDAVPLDTIAETFALARTNGVTLTLTPVLTRMLRHATHIGPDTVAKLLGHAPAVLTIEDPAAVLSTAGCAISLDKEQIDGDSVIVLTALACGHPDPKLRRRVGAWLETLAATTGSSRRDRSGELTALARISLTLPDTPELRTHTLAALVRLLSQDVELAQVAGTLLDEGVITWEQVGTAVGWAEGSALLTSILAGSGWRRTSRENTPIPQPRAATLRKLDRAGDHAPLIHALSLLRSGAGHDAGHSGRLAHTIFAKLWPAVHRDPTAAARVIVSSGAMSEYLGGSLGVTCDPAVVTAIVQQVGETLNAGANGGDAARSFEALAALTRHALDHQTACEDGRAGACAVSVDAASNWIDLIAEHVNAPVLERVLTGWQARDLLRRFQAAALARRLTNPRAWETAAGLIDTWQSSLAELTNTVEQL